MPLHSDPEDARTFTVELSADEVAALVNFHASRIRRITKTLGQATLKLRSSLLPSSRAIKAVIEQAEELTKHHADRGRVLLLLINPKD